MRQPFQIALLWLIVVLMPVAMICVVPVLPSFRDAEPVVSPKLKAEDPRLGFRRTTIGPEPGYYAWITNVTIHDLDRDGIEDVIVCDARQNSVF